MEQKLIFIKLGGSLITDKDRTETANEALLADLLGQIEHAMQAHPGLQVLLGHGSGSYGHHAARLYGTMQGVETAEQWRGFAQVWGSARTLNQIVVQLAHRAGLPVISFAPSACVRACNGAIISWDTAPVQEALRHGLLPLVYGDTVFDQQKGGTILSTEDLFCYLAPILKPQNILLAGKEEGVYADFPTCQKLVDSITASSDLSAQLQGSGSVDVTGGMRSKVLLMQELCRQLPGLQVSIFSGSRAQNLFDLMMGKRHGTLISSEFSSKV